MPLFREIVSKPSLQDEIDLGKIYSELHPMVRFPRTEGDNLPDGWVRQFIDSNTHILVAARFNGRLLGACVIDKSMSNHWRLINFSVRKVTHRRGVGRFLIEEVMDIAQEAGEVIESLIPTDNDALLSLFGEQGWDMVGNEHGAFVFAYPS